MLPKRSFKPAKCKTALSLAKSRIKLMKNKKAMQLTQLKRELAQLLESGHDQTARIRVEHVVREEKMIEAYEMIEIYCELVVARLPIIESQKNCPLDLKEAIASLIFAAPRCGDIVELQDVRKHFTAKYGKEFASAAVELRPGSGVSRNLVQKLSAKAPDGQTKVKILTAIAEEHSIKWEPNWFKDEDPMLSADIPMVPVAHKLEANKIQMQPLNFGIAEDQHAHDKAKPGTSQSYAHPNNDSVPPSFTSHSASRPPENSSEKMVFSRPSHTAESTFVTGRQNWNMEFKDANAAAQAAAESAERASQAARAAAQFSSHSNVISGSSSETVHSQSKDNCHDGSTVLQPNQVHGNSISNLYNQRSSRMENDRGVNQQDSMREEGDAASVTDNSIQYGAQYEMGKLDDIERRNRRKQTRDSDSGPSTSGPEPNMFRSSYLEEYEIDSSENPFHEDTVERKNQSSSPQYQSSTYGDNYGVFENSKYDDYQHDSGDGFFGSSSRKTADQEDWQVRNDYTYGADDMTFKDHRVGSDSRSDIFAGINHRMGNDEKSIDLNAGVHFDESDYDDDDDDDDDDDVHTLNSAVEHNLSSPAEHSSKGFSLNQDKPHYERDLSESFRKSSIYSELIKPLPLTFDGSDGESSGSEKELQKEKSDPEFPGYDYQKPDANPDLGFMKSSYARKGTDDSFTSSTHFEENQNRNYGSVSKYKLSFHDSDDSDDSPPYNYTSSAAVATNFESRSGFGVLDKEKPHKSLQSRIPESQHPVSEFEYEAQPRPDGTELNLGSLPGGRRNRAHWRIPSAATEAGPGDTYGSTGKASAHEIQVSTNQTDNKQVPEKMSRIHLHYDPPDNETEMLFMQKGSKSAESPYRSTSNENVSKISPKHPTRYFDSDESSSEEDVPKPIMSKTLVDAGRSRRTKGSAPRSGASSETSAAAPKTRRPSISYATEVSSSRIPDLSSSDGEASDDDYSLKSSMEDRSTIPKSSQVPEASNSNEKAPSREKFTKNPSHVHPKLPDFETFAATFQSLRKNH